MVPVMRVDDAVIIRGTDAGNLNVGDIITFHAFESDIVITHRITDINNTPGGYEFNTKGDANNTADNFTTPESRVIGKYMLSIPRFGSFVRNLNENPLVIAAPVIVLMAVQFLFGLLEKNLNPKKNHVKEPETAAAQEENKPKEDKAEENKSENNPAGE
jgi:signal peptidase I